MTMPGTLSRAVRLLALNMLLSAAVVVGSTGPSAAETATATFAAGCYWCVEKAIGFSPLH